MCEYECVSVSVGVYVSVSVDVCIHARVAVGRWVGMVVKWGNGGVLVSWWDLAQVSMAVGGCLEWGWTHKEMPGRGLGPKGSDTSRGSQAFCSWRN